MIIWSGLGTLVPVIAVAGIFIGSFLAKSVGQPRLGIGTGLAIAALLNFLAWKMIYPKNQNFHQL